MALYLLLGKLITDAGVTTVPSGGAIWNVKSTSIAGNKVKKNNVYTIMKELA